MHDKIQFVPATCILKGSYREKLLRLIQPKLVGLAFMAIVTKEVQVAVTLNIYQAGVVGTAPSDTTTCCLKVISALTVHARQRHRTAKHPNGLGLGFIGFLRTFKIRRKLPTGDWLALTIA